MLSGGVEFLTPSLNKLLDDWLDEDLGRGDLSAAALQGHNGRAFWITKQEGVFCGGYLAKAIFSRLEKSVTVKLLVDDGQRINPGQRLLELQGPAHILVAGERTALNLAMHLSGVATATSVLVEQLEGTGVLLADTRKTTPGLRVFEKYAMRCGGGVNHRFGLDDAAMLKENHIAWTKDLGDALLRIRSRSPWPACIIVEAETRDQAVEAICAGADGVLLDEFSPEELKSLIPQLRALVPGQAGFRKSGHIVIEASGVKVEDLRSYSQTGVDLISTSASITKSSWLDFSMRFEPILSFK